MQSCMVFFYAYPGLSNFIIVCPAAVRFKKLRLYNDVGVKIIKYNFEYFGNTVLFIEMWKHFISSILVLVCRFDKMSDATCLSL